MLGKLVDPLNKWNIFHSLYSVRFNSAQLSIFNRPIQTNFDIILKDCILVIDSAELVQQPPKNGVCWFTFSLAWNEIFIILNDFAHGCNCIGTNNIPNGRILYGYNVLCANFEHKSLANRRQQQQQKYVINKDGKSVCGQN